MGTPLESPDRFNLDRIGSEKKRGQRCHEQERNDPTKVKLGLVEAWELSAPCIFCVWQHGSLSFWRSSINRDDLLTSVGTLLFPKEHVMHLGVGTFPLDPKEEK